MGEPQQIWLEISSQEEFSSLKGHNFTGLIAPAAVFATAPAQVDDSVHPRFVRRVGSSFSDLADPHFALPDHRMGLAIDAPRGMADIDEAGGMLRVYEARHGLADGTVPLIAFLFPTLESLALEISRTSPVRRLKALALDERALAASLQSASDDVENAAPLIHARARLVAHARQFGVPAYLRPHDARHETQTAMIARATRDGFNGMILPPQLVANIKHPQ